MAVKKIVGDNSIKTIKRIDDDLFVHGLMTIAKTVWNPCL